MSSETTTRKGLTFRVLDAMDAHHSVRILRLRLQSREPPSVKSRQAAAMLAVSVLVLLAVGAMIYKLAMTVKKKP